MAPVVEALRRAPGFEPLLISTGQHSDLLDQAFDAFGLQPTMNLRLMKAGQSLSDVLSRVVSQLSPILKELQPAAVLVQGDTTTALGAALAAFHERCPVGHVEAGLRTYQLTDPFPEEGNRQLIARVSRWLFAPTQAAKDCLLNEGIAAESIFVTGNTAVDALMSLVSKHRIAPRRTNTVLLTLHRRESFGEPLREVLSGVTDFLSITPEATVLWPVHPNPSVRALASQIASHNDRIVLGAPLTYLDFIRALASCRLVLTDSGGVQEEAPSLAKPVLVARDHTERMEGVIAGNSRLVGRSRSDVAAALQQAWNAEGYVGPLPAPNPYGDGQAAERIRGILGAALAIDTNVDPTTVSDVLAG